MPLSGGPTISVLMPINVSKECYLKNGLSIKILAEFWRRLTRWGLWISGHLESNSERRKKMWDWNPSWTYVQFLWPGLWSDICWESLQACIQLWLFLCPVLNYKSFEMLQPNLNDLFLGVKTTFPMNGTFNFCQKRTYKGQIPDFLAKSGPFPGQFWSFSVIIFINLSTIIFQSSLTGKFIWVDQEHTNPEHFLAKILILAEDHNILLCPQLVWNLSNFLFLDLEIKIRRFSG